MQHKIVLHQTLPKIYILWDADIICEQCGEVSWLVTDDFFQCVTCECERRQQKTFRVMGWTITLAENAVIAIQPPRYSRGMRSFKPTRIS